MSSAPARRTRKNGGVNNHTAQKHSNACMDKQPKQTDPAGASSSLLLFGEVILICFAY